MLSSFLRSIITSFLITVLVFVPISLNLSFQLTHADDEDAWQDYENYTVIDHDTVWSGNITKEDIPKPVVVVNRAVLTIEKGTHIELKKLTVYSGRIVAQGTEQDKIVFTKQPPDFSWMTPDFERYDKECFLYAYAEGTIEFSDWVETGDESPSLFRYVEFDNMGQHIRNDGQNCPAVAMRERHFRSFFVDTVYAAQPIVVDNPVLRFYSGRLHIENSSFQNSPLTAIEATMYFNDEWESYDYVQIVNSNFESNPSGVAVASNFGYGSENHRDYSDRLLLKNNWYGASTGPTGQPEQNPVGITGNGARVDGTVTLDGYRKKDLIADPVVIIPGIMGSEKAHGKWQLDPILHTYDDLVSSLEKNGYQENINLFPFPYDWRNTNMTTVQFLREKMADVTEKTKVSKVDVVAHSMGGLVARAYIEAIDGIPYENTIDQLITLGTPQRGSPEAYLKWEAGEGFFRLGGIFAKHHFEQEAEEFGYDDNLKGYIQDKVVSVKELLPDQDYLYDMASSQMRSYPDQYPKNSFLEALNSSDNVIKLDPIRFSKIIGETSAKKTISKIRIRGNSMGDQWEHGVPENFYDKNTDQGLEYSDGDETVPLESADGVASDETIKSEASHGDLPTKAQCEIFKKLTGITQCQYNENIHIPNILLFNVFSPIDIQIISPSGKKVGKNFANGEIYDEIPGAYYTGYDTVNEFITIPNPEDGEYKIVTQGTGDGSYRIEATKISETNPGEAAKESTVSFSGNAIPTVQEEKTIALLSDDTVASDEEGDTAPPVTTVSLTGTQGTNSWYTSDVTVTLTTADGDNGSGVDTTEYSLDNGMTWQTYADSFVVSTESTTTIQYFSTDKQGNKEEKKTETIKIDKTAPEAKISFNSTTQKLDISGIDALSSVSVVTVDKLEMKTSNKQIKNIKSWFTRWFDRHKKSLPDMLVTLTDEAGHTMSLTFEKTKDRYGFVFVRLLSIGYDGSETILKDTDAQYKWRVDKKKGIYQLFAASLKIEAFRIEFHYNQKKNETWIMEKSQDLRDDDRDDDSDKRTIMKKLPGMVVPYLVSEQGGMRAKY